MSVLSKEHFHNEEAAIKHLEGIIWANGVVCPKCGSVDSYYVLNGKDDRPGLKKCKAKECGKKFTVKVGTVFEDSHIPVHKWLQAVYLMSASKKGFSAHQLHRTLEVTYKTAWFMAHRVREAMRELHMEPMGGKGKIVEADETYLGGLEKNKHANKRNRNGRGAVGKEPVLSLVERGGKVRSHHVQRVTTATLLPILTAQVNADTRLMTDEARQYIPIGKEFAEHGTCVHSIGEYVRGDIHTNTIEGFFSIFKRGMKGTYQHCSATHLKRYLCEFDFRYNNKELTDSERTIVALEGIKGKRLTYEIPRI
jgi:transposase-like protein